MIDSKMNWEDKSLLLNLKVSLFILNFWIRGEIICEEWIDWYLVVVNGNLWINWRREYDLEWK